MEAQLYNQVSSVVISCVIVPPPQSFRAAVLVVVYRGLSRSLQRPPLWVSWSPAILLPRLFFTLVLGLLFFKAKNHLSPPLKTSSGFLLPAGRYSCRPSQSVHLPSSTPKLCLFLLFSVSASARTSWDDPSHPLTSLLPVWQASAHNCDPFQRSSL